MIGKEKRLRLNMKWKQKSEIRWLANRKIYGHFPETLISSFNFYLFIHTIPISWEVINHEKMDTDRVKRAQDERGPLNVIVAGGELLSNEPWSCRFIYIPLWNHMRVWEDVQNCMHQRWEGCSYWLAVQICFRLRPTWDSSLSSLIYLQWDL